jgi:hypothetical protein
MANAIPENRSTIPNIGKSFLILLGLFPVCDLLQVYFQRIKVFFSWGTARRVVQRLNNQNCFRAIGTVGSLNVKRIRRATTHFSIQTKEYSGPFDQ